MRNGVANSRLGDDEVGKHEIGLRSQALPPNEGPESEGRSRKGGVLLTSALFAMDFMFYRYLPTLGRWLGYLPRGIFGRLICGD